MASRQFATFEVADQLFGVEVNTVQEVLSYNEYTPVPLAPPAVGGLFNLRGQVIAAMGRIGIEVLFGQAHLPEVFAGSTACEDRVRRRKMVGGDVIAEQRERTHAAQ